jgi:Ca-activated chloride channel family protein
VSFASPAWLAVAFAVPAALLVQWLVRRRARRYALRFPALTSVREAVGRTGGWRRHIPLVAMLLGVAVLAAALARPRVSSSMLLRSASLVLVLDHSGSMDSTDVKPTRLAAAIAAANAFVDQLPSTIRVGVVGFSTTADIILAPTTNRGTVRRTLGEQSAYGATATGDALTTAVDMIEHERGRRGRAAIVLLSDGAANAGQNPVAVAGVARRDDITVDTVALGTPNGTLPNTDPFGPPVAVPPDPQLMRAIAQASEGRSFSAQDAGSLNSIYKGLGTALARRPTRHDTTAAFIGAGLALLLAAGLAAVRRAPRLP